MPGEISLRRRSAAREIDGENRNIVAKSPRRIPNRLCRKSSLYRYAAGRVEGMHMRIDPRLIIEFTAVAEEASFAKAAARLRIAQPWLSARIRRLEELLGFPSSRGLRDGSP